MTTLASPSTNEIQNVIAVANSFVRGTDTTITLTDGSAFPNAAHVIRIRNLDNTKWCLVIYTSKAGNVLTMGGGAADYALAKCVTVGDEAYEWPAGSIVELASAADEIAQLFSEDGIWTKNRDADGYDIADLGKLNFDDATELTIAVTETQICVCDATWDTAQGADVVCSADAGDKQEGTHSAKMAVGAGAAAGLLASEAITSADITGYSRIRLWIKCSIGVTEGQLQFIMDNTAACASPIHFCKIPALTANTWTEVDLYFDPTVAGSTAVISVGIKQIPDLGACDIWIDDVRVTKGAVTITQSYHKIDAENGTASRTCLDTINGGAAGDLLFLRAEDGARTIVLRHGSQNIIIPAMREFLLDDAKRACILEHDGANWRVLNTERFQSSCFVYLSGAQSISDSEYTWVAFDTIVWDENDEWDPAAYLFRAKCPGKYLVIGQALPALVVDQKLILGLLYHKTREGGGPEAYTRGRFYASGTAIQGPNTQGVFNLASGEYINFTAYVDLNGGGPTTLNAGADYSFIYIVRIA